MNYRKLGSSGLKVSPLCLGAMMFGGRTTTEDSLQIAAIARDAGINFIDTANAYNQGQSEIIVKEIEHKLPQDWVVATKVCNPVADGPNDRGLSRRHLIAACEASLQRLGRGHIDLYYLHKEDHDTPLDETVGAIGDLIRDGKIRYWGISNFRAWRIADIIRICDQLSVPRPIAAQPLYNLLNRMAEVEVLPCCAHFGIGVVPYSPLARGMLTGKYASLSEPNADSRAGRSDRRMMQTEWRQESLDIAKTLSEEAGRCGTSLIGFSIAWVLNNRAVSSAIVGPRTEEQMRDYLEGMSYRFTAKNEALVNQLVITGHASTPGYNDPAYPIEGRETNVA